MLASDLRALQQSYQDIYEEGDGISCEMIEEIVEELIEECIEFGHNIDEAADVVEQAALQYLMELNPYAPAGSKEARSYQKSTTATRRGEARKTAVKAAKEKVKAKVKGAVAGAGIAASMAKDSARRAARTAVHKVSYGAQKKKAEVKSGVKSLIGKGLRKAAGAVGKVAQKAAGAASKLGEGKEQLQEKPGDGYLGPTPIPNPIRLAKDAVDATNRASQKKVDAVNAVLPGSASMPKTTYFNKGPSAASQKYLGLRNSYEPDANLVDEQNAGPSTPVKFDSHMGQLVPNMGAGRPANVRLKPGMGLKKGGTVKEGLLDIGRSAAQTAGGMIGANKGRQTGIPGAGAVGEVLGRQRGGQMYDNATAPLKKLPIPGLKKGGTVKKEEVEVVDEQGPALPGENRPGTPKAPGGRPHLPGEKQTPAPKKLQLASYQPEDIYDIVMEYLLQTEQAETISEAQYIMSQIDIEMIQSIVEQLTPLGVKTAGVVDDQRRGSTRDKDLKDTRDALDKMKPYPKGFPGV